MSRHRPAFRRAAVVLAAVTGCVTAVSAIATADPAPDVAPSVAPVVTGSTEGSEPGQEAVRVTLLTGDVVTVSQGAGGPMVSVDQAVRDDGTTPAFDVRTTFDATTGMDDVTVVPEDAVDMISAGQLDRQLFNVSDLARYGYGLSEPIPVISSFDVPEAAQSTSQVEDVVRDRAGELEGASIVRALPTIEATALSVTPGDTEAFWGSVTTVGKDGSRGLSPEVSKLILDAPVHLALDDSVGQIGAPQAWAAGYDGEGVTVAVLDTGIDAAHPDVAGKVLDSASFIPGQTVQDGHGHGTHVAATVAGTGEGSGGIYTGVAPGADLLVGKVLDNAGDGTASSAIAGMEWAVAQGADVVNMSLSAVAPVSEADDVLAHAVDRLSAESDVLFVVAAGNAGPAARTVGSPGTATSALTVAAVDDADVIADFSSRGPLPYEYAAVGKPDISAPGVGIIAARASGTSMGTPVDSLYTSSNGTSMATPHVAGAAAILAQARPEWTGTQIRDALTASATSVEASVFETGAGRVDVPTALSQTLTSRGSVDFGRSRFPSTAAIERTLTFANQGDADASLTLAAQLTNDEGEDFTTALDLPETTDIAARDSAQVEMTLDAGTLPEGNYSGVITGTSTDGRSVRTAVAFVREPETMRLIVSVTGRQGEGCTTGGLERCSSSGVRAMNLDNPEWSAEAEVGQEMHVRPGRYAVWANVSFPDQGRRHVATMVKPEVLVENNPLGAQIVSLPLSAAHPVAVSTERPSEAVAGSLMFHRQVGDHVQAAGWLTGYRDSSMWALPQPTPVTIGQFTLVTDQQRVAVPLTGEVVDSGTPLHPRYTTYAPIEPKFPASLRARVVDVGDTLEPDEAAALDGAIALATPSYIPVLDAYSCCLTNQQEAAFAAAGAIGVLVWSPSAGHSVPYVIGDNRSLPVAGIPTDEGWDLVFALEDGPVEVDLRSVASTPYVYSLKFYEHNRVGNLTYTVEDDELAAIPSQHRGVGAELRARMFANGKREALGEHVPVTQNVLTVAPADIEHLVGPPHDDQVWARWTTDREGKTVGYREGHLEAEEYPQEVWNELPLTLGAAVADGGPDRVCTTCRQGDMLTIRPTLTTSDPSFRNDPAWPGFYYDGQAPIAYRPPTSGLTLYAGEQVISPRSSAVPGGVVYEVPEDESTMRVVFEHAGAGLPLEWEYGRESRTEWEFTSSRPTADTTAGTFCPELPDVAGPCAPQALLQLRYDVDLDQYNRAPRSGTRLDITGYHESTTADTAQVHTMTVEVSYDDGLTWSAVQVSGEGDTRTTTLPAAPRDATAVSLRVSAVDAAGASITQELIRSFGIGAVDRVAGADRYETAAKVAAGFGQSDVVYLASGVDFPDALAGTAPAVRDGAPVLLTNPGRLPQATRTALVTADPKQIIVLGGVAAVSEAVLADVRDLTGADVVRVAGKDRYATAAAIAMERFEPGQVDTVYVSSSMVFADSLSAGPLAGTEGNPILLTAHDHLSGATAAALEVLAPERVVVLGGEAAVSAEVLTSLQDYAGTVERIAGGDRYATAALVADRIEPSDTVVVASGATFPDALAGAALAGRDGAPLLLTQPERLPSVTGEALVTRDPSLVTLLGGDAAIAEAVRAVIERLLAA